MKLIAHRGLHSKNNENTIEAFNKAIKNKNYVGFECDIRQTKDKKYIINHDSYINDLLIKNNNSSEFNKDTIFDILKIKTNKLILIEIKDSDIDTEKINNILNSHTGSNIYVMSFHNNVIKKLYNLKHNYKLGILNYVLNSKKDYPYDFVCLLDNFASKNNINNYFKNDIEVFIYGILDNKFDHGNKCFYITDKVIK